MKPIDFRNKIAIITGAGNGLGKCTAINLAQLGASVMVADINVENAIQFEMRFKVWDIKQKPSG